MKVSKETAVLCQWEALKDITFWFYQPSHEGIMLKMPASEFLYGGQFTLSTHLIKPNYLIMPYTILIYMYNMKNKINCN